MDMKLSVVLVLLVGMVSGGVLSWLGMVDNDKGLENHKKEENRHHKKDVDHRKNNEAGGKYSIFYVI